MFVALSCMISVTDLQTLLCLVYFERAIFFDVKAQISWGLYKANTKSIIVNICTDCILQNEKFIHL